jgi:hypothetical protein
MNVRVILGGVLVLLGSYLFFNRGSSFGPGTLFGYFWPSLFVIPVGLFFHWLYFFMGRKGAGVLIPGGIILVAGIVCQIAMLFDGWSYMWPGFILAVAIGLFEFYWFGGRNKWLLIPINILMVLSLLFFAVFSISTLFDQAMGKPWVAFILMLIGAVMLISRKREV